MFTRKIGIDLGTANTIVFAPKRGFIIFEPTIVALSSPENVVLAVGKEAKEMIGRTPADIKAYRPLKDGVIADYYITKAMLKYFISHAVGSFNIFKPDVVISAPAGITQTERRAVINAAKEAGVKRAYIVREPILAALGAGIPVNARSGNMIVNIGGGTMEAAIISLGGIVSWASGLPKDVVINSNEIAEAINPHLLEIIAAVQKVFNETPPELVADVMDKGIILSGGGAQIANLPEFFKRYFGVNTYVAEEPIFCVAKGTGMILNHLDAYKRTLLNKS